VKNSKNKIFLQNPNFWGVIFLTASISLLYLAWPWRELHTDVGIWQWPPKVLFSYLGTWEAVNKIFGSLYAIPIIYGVLAFHWYVNIRWYVSIGLLAFLGSFPILLGYSFGIPTLTQNTFILLLPFVIALLVKFETEIRRRERDFIVRQENQHRLYTTEKLKADERVRQRIAQELHDETIQNFLAIASFAKALESDAKDDTAKSRATIIRDVSLKSVEEVRRIVQALKPKILDDLGLVPALNRLVSSINSDEGIHAKIFVDGTERSLDKEIDIIIFRIVQEALNNIKMHAKATETVINLEYFDNGIKLIVRDNGQGFDTHAVMQDLVTRGQMGLIGIRERVESLAGTIEIHSNLGEGTIISINLKC
jgi:signal transduction histidine kinase